jgi:hypothetical protein
MAYYFVLRAALRSRADLRRCLTRCWHCRIFFLADPRNRGRRDLGCPFGCREAHRKERSAQRSAAYYQTPAGKEKKRRLNSGRRQAAEARGSDLPQSGARAELDETEFDAEIVEHVQLVTSLIEGFEVSREEVVAMLSKTVRQRRIVREKHLDYVLRWLVEHPP